MLHKLFKKVLFFSHPLFTIFLFTWYPSQIWLFGGSCLAFIADFFCSFFFFQLSLLNFLVLTFFPLIFLPSLLKFWIFPLLLLFLQPKFIVIVTSNMFEGQAKPQEQSRFNKEEIEKLKNLLRTLEMSIGTTLWHTQVSSLVHVD